jgi:hypothetical protein
MGTSTNMPARPLAAASVSAALHRNGFHPLPSGTPFSREGLRVRQSLTEVHVNADLDDDAAALAMTADVSAVLTELGYTVRGAGSHLWVSR